MGGEGQLGGQEGGLVSCKIGVVRSPVQFMHEALKAEHPLISASLGSADDLLRNIFLTLTMGRSAVIGRRSAYVKRLELMAEDLAENEEVLTSEMDPGVKRIMKGKRIALMKALMRELGVKDDFLITSLLEGFDLLGEIPPCGEFPSEVVNATTSLDDLWSTSKWAQFAVKGVVGKPSERRDAPLSPVWKRGPSMMVPFSYKTLQWPVASN